MAVIDGGDLDKLFGKDLGIPVSVVDAWVVDKDTQVAYPVGIDLPVNCPLLEQLLRVPSDVDPMGVEYRAPKGWIQGSVEGPKGEGTLLVDADGKSWNVSGCVGVSGVEVTKPVKRVASFPWPVVGVLALAGAAYFLFLGGK
jgi:hypothetical protein